MSQSDDNEIRTLYPLVARFAVEQLGAMRVAIINQLASEKPVDKSLPDLLAVSAPMTALRDGIIGDVPVDGLLFVAFEVLRAVNPDNLRECFRQALLTTLWAHVGYLVAAEWSDEPEFRQELRRLSQAYGVGAIRVDVEHPERVEILLPARPRDTVDEVALLDILDVLHAQDDDSTTN